MKPARPAPARRVGIVDVAAKAGVSVGTASKALNGRGRCGTRPAPGSARPPHELGFAPARVARQPAHRPDVHRRRHHDRQLRPVQHPGHARRRGLPRARRDDRVPVRQPRRPDPRAAPPAQAAGRQVDGIIVAGRRTDAAAARWATACRCRSCTPSAAAATRPTAASSATSGGAARLAVEHLRPDRPPAHRAHHRAAVARLGRRAGRRGGRGAGRARPRARSASRSSAAGPRPGAGSPRPQCRRAHPEVDGVFCGSDVIARGVADGLREAGLSAARRRSAWSASTTGRWSPSGAGRR